MFTNSVAFIGMVIALGAAVIVLVWSIRNWFETKAIENVLKNQSAPAPVVEEAEDEDALRKALLNRLTNRFMSDYDWGDIELNSEADHYHLVTVDEWIQTIRNWKNGRAEFTIEEESFLNTYEKELAYSIENTFEARINNQP